MRFSESTHGVSEGSARDALRRATRQVHEALHHNRFLEPLASGRIDLPQYRTILSRLYGFHAPLEAAFETAAARLELESVLGPRRRVATLRRDLGEIGFSPAQIEALPQASHPPMADPAEFYGAFYVREGSTLGGRLLASRLLNLLPDPAGRRFLSGRDEDPGLWSKLVVRIESDVTQETLPRAISSARATFAAMERWLDYTPNTR